MKSKGIAGLWRGILLAFVVIAVLLAGACAKPAAPPATTATAPPTTTTVAPPLEVIKLRWATGLPPTHPYSVAHEEWMTKIEKDSGGRIQFIKFWAGSLLGMGELNDGINKGSAEVALGYPSMTKPFPFYFEGTNFYMRIGDPKISRRIYREVLAKFPVVIAEYGNVKPMAFSSPGGTDLPYTLYTKTPFRALTDLKGKSIRTEGAQGDLVKEYGGSPVVGVPASELYTMLSKNVLDGVFHPLSSAKSLNFHEVTKYITLMPWWGPSLPMVLMNGDAYKRLPPDMQKVFDDNIDFGSDAIVKYMRKGDEDGLAWAKQQGMEIVKLPQAELDKIGEFLTRMGKQTAASIDAKGLPGTDIFNEIQRLMKLYGVIK